MITRGRERTETLLEKALFASRWLLDPFYMGLALSIGILLIKFVQELIQLAVKTFVASEADIILGVLTLVDLSLTGSLLLIVIFSGYENFVSKIGRALRSCLAAAVSALYAREGGVALPPGPERLAALQAAKIDRKH
jgi:uncharacterized membrane protein YqhA